MFKNRNRMTKISNAFLLTILVLSLISVVSIAGNVFFDATPIEGYTKTDYLFNFIMMLIYSVFATISIVILNLKIDLYKDEYTMSKQLFNLLFVFAMLSTIINFGGIITTYFIYKEFSLITLLGIIFGYLLIYIVAFIYINRHEYLSKDNSTKTNVINFIVLFLLMQYASSIINILLKLMFNNGKLNDNLKSLGISIIMVSLIIIAYKLINRNNEKKEVVVLDSKEKNKKIKKKK